MHRLTDTTRRVASVLAIAAVALAGAVALATPAPASAQTAAPAYGTPLSLERARDAIARVLGPDATAVTVIPADGVGCSGHIGADDVAPEAALCRRLRSNSGIARWTASSRTESD